MSHKAVCRTAPATPGLLITANSLVYAAMMVILHSTLFEKSLKNHILTKHEHHQCKECQENLPNFMQLLKHIADNHNKDQSETKDLKERDEIEELEEELSSLKMELL